MAVAGSLPEFSASLPMGVRFAIVVELVFRKSRLLRFSRMLFSCFLNVFMVLFVVYGFGFGDEV